MNIKQRGSSHVLSFFCLHIQTGYKINYFVQKGTDWCFALLAVNVTDDLLISDFVRPGGDDGNWPVAPTEPET